MTNAIKFRQVKKYKSKKYIQGLPIYLFCSATGSVLDTVALLSNGSL
jgi:hypothetical protein